MCALEKVWVGPSWLFPCSLHPLPVPAGEGLEGRSQDGESLLLGDRPARGSPGPGARSSGGSPAFPSPGCGKEQTKEMQGKNALFPSSPRGTVARRREGGRPISKAQSGAVELGSAPVPRPFPRVGGPPAQVCVLETWSRASSEPGQEAWSTACAPSEPPARVAAEGPGLLRTTATAPLWQLSPPNRKAIRRTGALLSLADVGKPRGPQSSPVTAPA